MSGRCARFPWLALAVAHSSGQLDPAAGANTTNRSTPPSSSNNTVVLAPARFTILSASLIRLEHSAEAANPAVWDERATLSFPNGRGAAGDATPLFTVERPTADRVTIRTAELVLEYDRSKEAVGCRTFTSAALAITMSNTGNFWHPGDSSSGNLGGSRLDLGCTSPPSLFDRRRSPNHASRPKTHTTRTRTRTHPSSLEAGVLVHRHRRARHGPVFPPRHPPNTHHTHTHTPPPRHAGYDTFEACYSNGLSVGPLSRDGWAVLDDTGGVRMDTAAQPAMGIPWYSSEHRCDPAHPGVCGPTATDWYFFGHGHSYRDAMADFAMVSGAAALPPRAAFGVWWSTWYDFSQSELTETVLQGYADHGLPLDVVVLDQGWHTLAPPAWHPSNSNCRYVWHAMRNLTSFRPTRRAVGWCRITSHGPT